ncbi:hypothetical protein EI164_05110 [Psychrobacter sp. FME13]|uniref:hypothetical protein n=1 Tax=Psychrobacter TaxID=497 RepID=UPI001787C820|nr:hypothetical protein [Psychrobacter sp. FME13]MBE0441445.1 hypothetical protein [Psychrobacter sp. FME13]
MRVSFVLNADQNIDQVIANRIRVIEHNFEMELQSFSIKQIDKLSLDFDFESLSSEEVKQALDGWAFNPRLEVRLVFKEVGNDE